MDYLREIERVFVSEGGGPFLAPADWEVARGWESEGVPLEAAVAGIRRALAAGGRRRGLRHCAAHVRAAAKAGPAPLPRRLREWEPPADLPADLRERLLEGAGTAAERLEAGDSGAFRAFLDALPHSAGAARSLEGYRSRMPADAFERLKRDASRREAARALGLPVS